MELIHRFGVEGENRKGPEGAEGLYLFVQKSKIG